ncbi:hypothetical protein N7448_006474 [Penicillium atrosanguineum]|uniref:F-box domain-containing protein n=1 Tax=Penicillium atrosanguineum TaxID=1132637 RepID=A0A9W9U2L2_9EURO|nr:uncharacterized protein N7443_010236 [Penicillium atrosanguineum]KAJ5132316.1 hypothetical protein N7448_006474 [Penicillium atrosanguineum]KAJ5289983.1 hypothetical protein N7443_010236 [Penicillium atrosanguineum]KAJ5307805.1 hypothetical protein N7476_008461 [Penicillium atrosanguineum]
MLSVVSPTDSSATIFCPPRNFHFLPQLSIQGYPHSSVSTKACLKLPAEIILLIAEHLWMLTGQAKKKEALMARQRNMRNFSEVSKAFHWAAARWLYRCPELGTGESLIKFERTVSQYGTKLGRWLQVLELGKIEPGIHNELLARLLSQTKPVIFEAPPTPFGVEGLTALSASENIQKLDLGRVSGIEFLDLKQTISHLPQLEHVTLPFEMAIVDIDISVGDWPASIESITLGGTLDPDVMHNFQWPTHPFDLVLRNCRNLPTVSQVATLDSIFASETIREFLVRLYISSDNGLLSSSMTTGFLYSLPNLVELRIPLDMVEDFLILPAPVAVLPIKVLELDEPGSGSMQKKFTSFLRVALDTNLSNLVSLGLPQIPPVLWKCNYHAIHNKLAAHVRKTPSVELPDLHGSRLLGLWNMSYPQDSPACLCSS